MQRDFKRISIENIVHKAFMDIEEDPRRGLRNLVDLGVNFAKGRFQKPFLRTIQNMLEDEDSAYYTLLEQLLKNTTPAHLSTFGINVGYNSCTMGANIIRSLEERYRFNIPWALSLQIDAKLLQEQPDLYADIIEQGNDLGIYTYFLYVQKQDPLPLLPIIRQQSSCAFVLLLRDVAYSDALYDALASIDHLITAVFDDGQTAEACRQLRRRKTPYAIYYRYHTADIPSLLDDRWANRAAANEPMFALLAAGADVSEEDRQTVYQYINDARSRQRFSMLLADLRYDQLMIDRIISDDECIMGFDRNGNLLSHRKDEADARLNITRDTLWHILDHPENHF